MAEMKILVIEDHEKIAKAIKNGLESQFYAVDIALDGKLGYDLASAENYDVIILDIMLPRMNGLEICQQLRQEGKQTPILMLTAKSQVEDKIKGLNQGADDYLSKPFDFEELLARIKALSRRPPVRLKIVLKVKDLSLNTLSYEVWRNKKKIDLSKKEITILEYLMQHQGQVLNKAQIIEKVWDFDADVLENTVEAHVASLRKKIDRQFPDLPPLIKTVRSLGYKIG